MGRKRLYHTKEEKEEAQRRNRMNWYDRNRKKILKAYKMRIIDKKTATPSTSIRRGETNTVAPHNQETGTAPSSSIVLPNLNEESTKAPPQRDVAPQILLARIHKQHRLLQEFMGSDAEMFSLRIAAEVELVDSTHQLLAVCGYMDKVATFIDGARPHISNLWKKFGAVPEWQEARTVQNSMMVVIEYLDEIHHRVEGGDLAEALSLNLLSFQ